MATLNSKTELVSPAGTETMYCAVGTGATADRWISFANLFNWISTKIFPFLKLKDLSGTKSVSILLNESLTANRNFNLNLNDGSRNFSMSGDFSVVGDNVINQDVGLLSSPLFYQPQLRSVSGYDLTLKNISTAVGSLSMNMTGGDRALYMNGDLTVSGDCEVDQDLTQTSAVKFQGVLLRYAATSEYLTIRSNSSTAGSERLQLDMKGGFRQVTMNGDLDVKGDAEINQSVLDTSTPQFDGIKDGNGVQILHDQQASVTYPTGTATGTDKTIISDLQTVVGNLIQRLETHALIETAP